MIIKALILLVINAISLLLTPFHFVNDIFGNFIESSGFIALVRFASFFFSPSLMTFCIDTLLFWASAFLIRPLINFIRNKS